MIIDKIKIGNTTYNVGARYQDVSGTPTKLSDFTNDEGFIDKSVNNLDNYTPSSQTTTRLELVLDSSTFKLKGILKDSSNNVIYTSNEIDLPLETVVVDGTYDSLTKEIVLELVNGNTIRFSVSALVSGLISDTDLATALENYYTKGQVDNLLNAKQNTITSSNKLDSDLVDDTNSTNKFVTSAEKSTWNGKQDELTAGENITIVNNVISASGGGSNTQLGGYIIKNTDSEAHITSILQKIYDEYTATNYFRGLIYIDGTGIINYRLFASVGSINISTGSFNINFAGISCYNGEYRVENKGGMIRATIVDNVVTAYTILPTSGSIYQVLLTNYTSADINGTLRFGTHLPTATATPTTNNQLTNKAYVDSAISSAITDALEGGY